jgi:serine/threonine protein kinase
MPSASDGGATIEMHGEEAYCSACNQSYPSGTKLCPTDGARLIKLAAQRDDLIGKVLDERYEIRAPLGKGGMGTVYRGWQLSVDREVAIKVIHPKLSDDRSAVKRFLREARLASRLSQPNIVNVYDFGQSDGVLYLAMELLRGHTLTTELGQGRRINPKRTITMALQLCDALEAAHAQGIVHRDMKPSNIVILDDPPGRDLIKVLDFGLAKSLVQDSGSIVTNTDALLGTPLYMSPEQIEGKDSDQRADLYSLGCILYEMLSGKPPFLDTAVSAVLARHIGDAPAPLPPHVPFKLRSLIESLLEKKPEKRIQSAGEVRKVLDDIREAGVIPTPQPFDTISGPADTIPDVEVALAATHAATPVPASSVVVTAVPPAPSLMEASSRGGSSAKRWGLIAVFMLVPLAVVVVMFTKTSSSPERPAHGGANLDGSGSAVRVTEPDAGTALANQPSAPLVDAGVASSTTVDAAVKKVGGPRPRPQPTDPPPPPPKATPDAGVKLDFVKKAPPLDFVKPKQ